MGLCSFHMRAIMFTLLSVAACTAVFAATVYRWVDENGVTHYSDQPHENAQKVTIAAPQTYSASKGLYKSTSQPPGPKTTNAVNNYASCTVVQPTNEATFQNTSSVSVAAQSSPTPYGGDQMLLLLDGAKIANFPGSGGSYTIDPIDRGQHTLQAVIQDSNGKTVCQSASVTFTVIQASTLNPTNPNFRH
jgi:Domain of unknown function (DUF4124)